VASSASMAGNHASLWGIAVAVTIHALVALALTIVPQHGLQDRASVPVELDVVPPPPEPLAPSAPPASVPPPPEPTTVVRRRVAAIKPPPPMPNHEVSPAPATAEPAAPVFGVTQESVVPGESPVAVPVGNTLMTKDRTLAKGLPAPLPPAPPPPPVFAPVDEDSVADFPEAYVKPEPEYPEVARRMGIGGKVLVRIGIDRKGNVKSVRVLEKVGYGMDEAAVKASWQSKWKPARRADGQPVDMVITYNIIFKSETR